jgi:preprotein translocase subunit YajC
MNENTVIAPMLKTVPDGVRRVGWLLLALGIAVYGAGYLTDPGRSAFANVVLFLFLASISGGAVFLLALEYITGAVWSVPVRRVTEFVAAVTPAVPLIAIPLLFSLHDVFHWAHAEALAGDRVLAGKAAYLNVQFFVLRFLLVFAVWVVFYILFTRNSRKQDTTRDPKLTTRNVRLAALFLPLFAVTLTITAVDWAMSLEPHWYSTIFGVYYFSGTALAAIACATYVTVLFHDHGFLPMLRADHFYSFGALLFAFVNFWAYIAFSQFMLIWYANIPEETVWFMARWKDGWEYVSVLLIFVHFVVPYFALLSQSSKMSTQRLKVMSLWILGAHILDLYWLVMPTVSPAFRLHWTDLAGPLVAAGLIMLVVSFQARRYNLLPVGDPKLERGLQFRL